MANRILAALTEKPGDYSAVGWRHSIEIQRSAAGQPGLLITASRQYEAEQEEEITVVVEDGLALLAPVLTWLLTDEVVEEAARARYERELNEISWEDCGEDKRVLYRARVRSGVEALIVAGQRRG